MLLLMFDEFDVLSIVSLDMDIENMDEFEELQLYAMYIC